MQTKKDHLDDKEIKESISALSVAMGFIRALDTDYGSFFTHQELGLTKHLCSIAKRSLNGLNWLFYQGFSIVPYGVQQFFFNAAVVPAYDQVIMLRKLMIKNKIDEAIINGVKQIVFLGGGYDVRAFITANLYPKVKVFELDRGPTRDNKIHGLTHIPRALGYKYSDIAESVDGTTIINDNLYFIECDLTIDNLVKKLEDNYFVEGKKSLFIAEGLTPYLSEEDNLNLLTTICNMQKEGDEVLLSYMSVINNSRIVDESLKDAAESHRFSLLPRNVIPFVKLSGYSVVGQFDATKMLASIGDRSDALLYQKNQNLPREHYYLLKKSEVDLNQDKPMDVLPDIDLVIPNKEVNNFS